MKETKVELILKMTTREGGDKLITPDEFSLAVEYRAINEGLTLLESVSEGLRIINFDGDLKDAAKLINKPLRERLGFEVGIKDYRTSKGKLPI